MTDSPEAQQPKPSGQPESNPPASSGQQQPLPSLSPQQVLAAQIAAPRALPYAGIPLGIPAQIPMLGAQQAQFSIQHWQGQFPPPEAVERYEKVLPGAFDRLIEMAETLQASQIEETRRAQEYTQRDTRRGHWLGFAAMALGMVCGLAALALAQPWVAVAFLSVPVMGVAKALVDSARAPSPGDTTKAASSAIPTAQPPVQVAPAVPVAPTAPDQPRG